MILRSWQSRMSLLCIGLMACCFLPPASLAQEDEIAGFIIGRVYEVDKTRYSDFLRKRGIGQEEQAAGAKLEIDPQEFLAPLGEVIVTARRLENNYRFDSNRSNDAGNYQIRDTPPGVYEFTLQYEGEYYPAGQRLGMKVDLGYIAELCFVIDREARVAWMVAAAPRRAPEVPPFVPTECQSELGACLAVLVGEDTLPDGLILLMAGSAAAATKIGIISAEEDEASPPVPKK